MKARAAAHYVQQTWIACLVGSACGSTPPTSEAPTEVRQAPVQVAPVEGNEQAAVRQEYQDAMRRFNEETLDPTWAAEAKTLLDEQLGEGLRSISEVSVAAVECRHHTCVISFRGPVEGDGVKKIHQLMRSARIRLGMASYPVSLSFMDGGEDPLGSGQQIGTFYFSFVRE